MSLGGLWADLGTLLASPRNHGRAIFILMNNSAKMSSDFDKTKCRCWERYFNFKLKDYFGSPRTQKQFRADTLNKRKVRRLRPTAVWING